MNDAETDAFLARPLIAVISTIGKDGTPRATPVWFLYRDGALFISTGIGHGWVRNVARRPAVALAVVAQEPASGAVLLRGDAEIHVDPPWGVEMVRAIAANYVEAERLDAYLAQLAGPAAVVKVVVTSKTGWSSGD